MIICYIGGNIGPDTAWFSTENAYADAFSDLGHKVVPVNQRDLVERQAGAAYDEIVGRCGRAPDLTIYTRTHNDTALREHHTNVWRMLETAGGKTASVHLDIFWGLPERHAWIMGGDPLFTTGMVFTADGGSDPEWERAGVNHSWLPPGADLRRYDDRYLAQGGDPSLRGKMVFIGSRGYHHQWPREAFVDHLEQQYGADFVWFGSGSPRGTVRGESLARVLASDCIVIGDHCFAGQRANYWSDRTPETLGRRGLLLQPMTAGMPDWYSDQDLIYWSTGDGYKLALLEAVASADAMGPEGRATIRDHGRATVLARDTYPHRAATMLERLDLA